MSFMSDDDYREKYGLFQRPFVSLNKLEKSQLVKRLYIDENLSKHHVATLIRYRNGSYRLFQNYGNFLSKSEEQKRKEIGKIRSGFLRRINPKVSKTVGGRVYYSDHNGWFLRDKKGHIRRYTERNCNQCNEIFMSVENKSRLCSRKCTNLHNSSSNNHSYRGLNTFDYQGYIVKSVDGRRVREHRKIFEDILGRRLSSKEVVHHINNRKTDNRLENLILVSHQQHLEIHKSYDSCLYELIESGILSFNRETLKYEVIK